MLKNTYQYSWTAPGTIAQNSTAQKANITSSSSSSPNHPPQFKEYEPSSRPLARRLKMMVQLKQCFHVCLQKTNSSIKQASVFFIFTNIKSSDMDKWPRIGLLLAQTKIQRLENSSFYVNKTNSINDCNFISCLMKK